MADWLTRALERDLRRVPAPDELWTRIAKPRPPRARKSVMMLALATLALWSFVPQRSPDPRQLALDALASPPGAGLQAGSLPQLRAWVEDKTGVDVPLPHHPVREVQVKGACEVKGNIEVAYRVRGHDAALVVSKTAAGFTGDSRHRFLKCEQSGDARISSWIMRGRLYTLAYAAPSGDLRDECLLCHNTPLAN